MKFLAVLWLLALAAADEDKFNDKKTQPIETTQNASSLTQPSLFNSQIFPPTSFSNTFGTSDPVSNLAYTGFNGNVSPIQTVNPDFFVNPASGVVSGTIPAFPVTRAVLPGTASVAGIQSAFPVSGNVFPAVSAVPAAVSAIPSQFPVGTGILTSGLPTGALDANTAAATTGAISPVAGAPFRFLTPEALTGIPTQGLQPVQQVGLAAIPAFTSGILPSLSNGVLQGQNIPAAAIQQVLKTPTGNPTGISNVPTLATGNISSGPLTNVFRHA